jgi:type II secretory pathway pseudopilin PulG
MKLAMLNERSSSESGFAMIEVIVSAAVLAIVALAVLSGIDGAQGSSAREKARAVAGSLAEADQERMRSMSVETLLAVPQQAPKTIDGATYTIKSEAQWVNDNTGGTPACGNSGNSAEYFHITSTVTSSIVGQRLPEVKIDSLVSPTVAYSQAHGTIGAKVVDGNGKGIPNISVSGTGPTALGLKSTDSEGCVVWRSVGVGTYTLTINVSGYCDENGVTNLSRQQTVSANTVSFVSVTYDRCASAVANVRTYAPGAAFDKNSALSSKARQISDVSSNGSLKTWLPTPPATSASSFALKALFPYPSSPYGFFTGECQYQNPEKLGLANYFATTSPGSAITADPSKYDQPAYVFQPPLNLRIGRNANGTTFTAGSIDVYLTLEKPAAFSTDTCADEVFRYTVRDYPATGWGSRPNPYTGYVSQDTATFDPGLPYGTYSICLRDKTNSKGVAVSTKYNNVDVGAHALVTISQSTGWQGTTTCT